MPNLADRLFFRPDDVDLSRSPLRPTLDAPSYVLGGFNPGLTRLESGNLLAMVRIAEALREPVVNGRIHTIRWTAEGYVRDSWPTAAVDAADPRLFSLKDRPFATIGLTSLSWLLPVELSPDGLELVAIHYERAIAPAQAYQEYGIEDARISRIEGRWCMTTCSVSAERHCTTLYTSDNGLDYTLQGIVLDHQNKDMALFEGKVGGFFTALTRPLGEVYFVYPQDSPYAGGPSINLSQSPDALHWKPMDRPGVRGRKGTATSRKVGGGSPPILTDAGWLMLYHGVDETGAIGAYRTFWALLDRDDPTRILRQEDRTPLLEADPALTASIAHQAYLPSAAVFTSGIVDGGEHYIVASGEADLACRVTHIPKARFG